MCNDMLYYCVALLIAPSWYDALPGKRERHCPDDGSMLVQRLRRWPNIDPSLGQCLPFAGWPVNVLALGELFMLLGLNNCDFRGLFVCTIQWFLNVIALCIFSEVIFILNTRWLLLILMSAKRSFSLD